MPFLNKVYQKHQSQFKYIHRSIGEKKIISVFKQKILQLKFHKKPNNGAYYIKTTKKLTLNGDEEMQ